MAVSRCQSVAKKYPGGLLKLRFQILLQEMWFPGRVWEPELFFECLPLYILMCVSHK